MNPYNAIQNLIADGAELGISTMIRGKFYFRAKLVTDGDVIRGEMSTSIEGALDTLEKALNPNPTEE